MFPRNLAALVDSPCYNVDQTLAINNNTKKRRKKRLDTLTNLLKACLKRFHTSPLSLSLTPPREICRLYRENLAGVLLKLLQQVAGQIFRQCVTYARYTLLYQLYHYFSHWWLLSLLRDLLVPGKHSPVCLCFSLTTTHSDFSLPLDFVFDCQENACDARFSILELQLSSQLHLQGSLFSVFEDLALNKY